MVCDITCLVDRQCYQHFRGIYSFHFRIEASGSRFLESWVGLATKLHGVTSPEGCNFYTVFPFFIKFVTPSNIIQEHSCINRNEKIETASHNDVDISLVLHVSAFVESRLQAM
jgi:hypothetical protein